MNEIFKYGNQNEGSSIIENDGRIYIHAWLTKPTASAKTEISFDMKPNANDLKAIVAGLVNTLSDMNKIIQEATDMRANEAKRNDDWLSKYFGGFGG